MNDVQHAERRTRLEELDEPEIAPFVRAPAITDASVYWMPVSQFPVLPRQREWLQEFHTRLAALLQRQHGLREEVFLQFKALYPDLIDRFTSTASDHMPMTGMSLRPGTQPAPLPDLKSIQRQVEDATKSGTGVDTARWTPDYLHWFARKRPKEQREHFFGHAGMMTLYLQPDPQTAAPVVEMPGFVKKLSVYDANMQDNIQAAYGLRDTFLAHSKEVFGEPFRNDPAYKGMAFILPLLSSASLLEATAEERAQWFGVFHGYFIESRQDSGMVLALQPPDFDVSLYELLRTMQEDGLVYRT